MKKLLFLKRNINSSIPPNNNLYQKKTQKIVQSIEGKDIDNYYTLNIYDYYAFNGMYYELKNKLNNDINNIKYYVIHLVDQSMRFNQIYKMLNILKQNINIFPAIYGKDIINLSYYNSELTCTYKTNSINEIGCYLSHFMLIDYLLNNSINEEIASNNYTVIFEDDFMIINQNLDNSIQEIINMMIDFDIIFLGTLNFNYTNEINTNIYIPTDKLWGTHAYLINNKSFDKIHKELINIDMAYDTKFENLYKTNKLKIYCIHPNLVDQNSEIESTIPRKYNKKQSYLKWLLRKNNNI